MRFIVETKRLETDRGELIKEFECPIDKKWDDLMPWADHWQRDSRGNEYKRLCGACNKCVINFQAFSESQIVALVQVNPGACGYLTTDHPDLREIVEPPVSTDNDDKRYWATEVLRDLEYYSSASCVRTKETRTGERIVKTARSLLALGEAVDAGYRPYFVRNESNGLTHQKLAVVYDGKERALRVSGDYRGMSALGFSQEDIDKYHGKGAGVFLLHDMERHPSPVAAYLLPSDIRAGERVFLEDLIEDRVSRTRNQGDRYRADSSFAIWHGDHLELEIPDSPNPPEMFRVLG